MRAELGYDSYVRSVIAATVAVFALVLVPALGAQINGVPASVTSFGFGGHNFFTPPGVPASITSLGPNGLDLVNPFFTVPTCCINPLFPINPNPPIFRHRRHRAFFPTAVPVVVPYTPVIIVQPGVDDSTEEESGGGPTIFDRRGPGGSERGYSDRYAERVRREERDRELAEPSPPPHSPASDTAVADQPETVLVFKDGHTVELRNYAIQGKVIYDLAPGHPRKIALADLDLEATVKRNDDRGIDFRVPPGADKN